MASPGSESLKRTYDEARLEDAGQYHLNATTIGAQHLFAENVTDSLSKPLVPPPVAKDRRSSSPRPKDRSTTAGGPPMSPTSSTNAAPTMNKRQKLSAADKEARKLEKEAKERQRAAERIKKEQEKRLKDAEKDERRRLKEEQLKLKEEEKRTKEDEKRRKDQEKRLREEEKEKKAKSQLRLNSFFVQPSNSTREMTGSLRSESHSPLSSRRSSIASIDVAEAMTMGRSTSEAPQKRQLPEYERSFLPFWVQPHTTIAPYNRFMRDEEGLKYVKSKIDECIHPASEALREDEISNPHSLLHKPSHQRKGYRTKCHIVKEVIARINSNAQHPIDLTDSKANNASDMLKSISIKYLRFAEDVRPPYIGTYTKCPSKHICRKLCKNPFTRDLPQTNYDYDSEAEWEEPGEGEDLDSEGEEEINEEEEDDDMEGFLDDEEGGDGIRIVTQKRRPIMGDLTPSCTGICWQDDYKNSIGLQGYKVEVILDRPQSSIDPYSTAYWPSKNTVRSLNASPSKSLHASMDPPRIPLSNVNCTNILFPNASTIMRDTKGVNSSNDGSTTMNLTKAPKRLIPPEVMGDFKIVVQGNDLTKAGLVEILKKQFPKQSKDAIKDTLGLIAERVGSKEAEKRWMIKAEYQQ